MAKLSKIKSINSFLKAVQKLADEEGDSAFGHAARHIASQLKPLLNAISIVSPFLGWKGFHVDSEGRERDLREFVLYGAKNAKSKLGSRNGGALTTGPR